MRRLYLHLLLSAGILMMGILPPAIQHTHADGQSPHDHTSHCDRHHSSDHHHPTDEAHPHPQESHSHESHFHESLTSIGETHVHLVLLGLEFQFSVPVSSVPEGQSTNFPCVPEAFVKLQGEPMVVGAASPQCLPVVSLGWEDHGGTDEHRSARQQRVPAIPPSAPGLLCDTARHERSGVQLM